MRGTRLPRSARRKQLLGAAQEIFVAQGYHAAAMDDIAERAGVSKPVLYQHFPGKLDLYLALLDQHATELVKKVRVALASTTDNRQRVEASVAAYFDFVDGDGEGFRLVFESDLRNDPAVRERVERMLQECVDAHHRDDRPRHRLPRRGGRAAVGRPVRADGGRRPLVARLGGAAHEGAGDGAARRADLARHLRSAALTRHRFLTSCACSGRPRPAQRARLTWRSRYDAT